MNLECCLKLCPGSLKCWSTIRAFCLPTSFRWLFNLRLNWVSDLPMHWIRQRVHSKMYITSLLLQSGLSEHVVSSFSDIAYKTACLQHRFSNFKKHIVGKPILFFEFFCTLSFNIFLHPSKSWRFSFALMPKLVSVKKCLETLY